MKFAMKFGKTILAALLLALFFMSIGTAVDYPDKINGKYLYDTAGVLTAQEYSDLNDKLIAYQQETTNEIAVVTTQDLQGQLLDQYAKGLFNHWGVGRADVENGVLILLSLDEDDRGTWVQPGDGAVSFINGDYVGNEIMIPYFRDGQWYDGLNAGVDAVMQDLPDSWPEPVLTPEGSAQAVPMRPEQTNPIQSQEGNGHSLTVILISAFITLGLIGILLVVIGSRRKQREAREEAARQAKAYKDENQRIAGECASKLAVLNGLYDNAKKELDRLKSEYPKSLWGQFEHFAGINMQTLKLEVEVAGDDAKDDKQSAERVRSSLVELGQKLAASVGVCERIIATGKEADVARGEAKSLLASLPKKLAEADKAIDHADVQDRAKGILAGAKAAFDRALAYGAQADKDVNWIAARDELQTINREVAEAVEQVKEDKQLAETARTEGPKMLAKISHIQAELNQKEADYRDSRSAQAAITEAREKIVEVQRASNADSTNWTQVYLLMNTIESRNREADHAYHRHQERLRQEAVVEAKRKADEAAAAERRRRASVSSSSPFSGGHSGSRGGGGSFSSHSPGFGGGHSGGRGGGGRF